jgi:hypothetical protein
MGKTLAGQDVAAPYQPDGREVVEFLKANAVVGHTERFWYLDRREAHYRGTQYDHQKQDWWGRDADSTETINPKVMLPAGFEWAQAQEVPVRGKRPTAPANLCTTIVQRFTGMLFSEGRKPQVVMHEDPDTEDWLREVVRRSGFWSQFRAARDMGGSVGSVLVTAHVREGQFAYETHNPKNLTVVWAERRTCAPRGVLKMYTYPVEVDAYDEKKRQNVVRTVECLYRRVITHEDDITYKPLVLEPGVEITWEEDPALSVHHGLGFFPGVWIQNTPDSEDIDGDADCEGAWRMLDTLDRLIAQMNHGVLMNLDPTLSLIYDPKEIQSAGGVRKGSENALHLGSKGQASYLEMTGAGIEIGMKLHDLLKRSILDRTRCVLVDPEKISGAAQSAKAIEYLFQPMIERAGDFREQYGEALVRLLKVTEMIGRRYEGQRVNLGRNESTGEEMVGVYRFALPRRVTKGPDGQVTMSDRHLGPGGTIDLEWGPFFAPTEQDDAARITNAAAAKQGGLVGGETATKHVSQVFGIQDPAAEHARAQGEVEEEASRAMAGMDGGVPFGGPAPPAPGPRPPRPGANGKPERQGPPAGAGGRE